jgi:RHS repeat-associated protein
MSGGSFTLPHTTYAYTPHTKRLTTITTTPVSGPPVVETLGLYDANGNPGTWTPPGESARTLKFDALGRLVEITGGYSASYRYDPFGRRIEKTEQSTTTRYQYDGLDVVAEYGASQLEATYVFGPGMDEVLKLKRGTTVAAYHSDGLGSVVSISDATSGGSLTTYRYDAFGKPIAQTGMLANAYTYTGRELDGSGLYYYRARYYLPSAGRFLTPDPIGLAGGINAYAYVSSNPVNYTDPFGLMAGRPFDPAAPEQPLLAGVPDFSANRDPSEGLNCPGCHLGHDMDPFRPTYPGAVRDSLEFIARQAYDWQDPFLGSYVAEAAVALPWAKPIKYLDKGDELVDIYRFVSKAELDDLMTSGKFRLGPSTLEAKQFGLNPDEVLDLATSYDSNTAAIIRARIPASAVVHWWTPVDRHVLRSGAITIPKEDLDMLNELVRQLDVVY